MAEQAFPLAPAMPDVLMLRPLIAPRDAARVALGGLHLGSPALEMILAGSLVGPVPRSALLVLAVQRHRSSIVVVGSAFSPAYHVATE